MVAGYSVTSGYYFNRTRFLYASSDPGWDYVGQVMSHLFNLKIYLKIMDSRLVENYFKNIPKVLNYHFEL